MKRFILVLIFVLCVSGVFAEDHKVLYEKRYSNCTLQLVESEEMFSVILFEIKYATIPRQWIISSYNEKLIKNFLFYLADNSLDKYDFTIIEKYEENHKELVLLEETTNINKNNTLTKRYSYKLELE